MALTSLKTSLDLTKAMLGLRDTNLVREKAVELTTQIISAHESTLAAQAAQSALTKEIDDLKAKIVKMEEWNRERLRYQLAEVATGVFAYTIKPDEKGTEPAHALCANCYDGGRKSVLQQEQRPHRSRALMCNACHAEIYTHGHPESRHAPSSGRVI